MLAGCQEAALDAPAEPIPQAEAPSAAAETLCGLRASCECEAVPGCDAEVQSSMNAWLQYAEEENLSYDAQCMGDLLGDLDSQGCAPPKDAAMACTESCRPIFGNRTKGAVCERFGNLGLPGLEVSLDDCAADLACVGGECVPRCLGVLGSPAGQDCTDYPYYDCREGLACGYESGVCEPAPGVGEHCGVNGICAEEAVCDWQSDECRSPPKTGDVCIAGQCAGDAWCGVDDLCEDPRAQGEGCSAFEQCESGYCPNGTCQPLPGAGKACYGACKGGLACVDEVCQDPVAAVCGF